MNENDSEIDANNAPEQSEPEQGEPEENNPDYNVTGVDNNTTSTQSNAGAEKIDTGVYPPEETEEKVDSTEQGSGNNSSTSGNNSPSSFDSDDNYIGANSVDTVADAWIQQELSKTSPEEIKAQQKRMQEAMESGKLQGLSEWAAGIGSSSTSESADQFGNSGISISMGGDTSSSDSPDADSGVSVDVGGESDSTSDSTGE